MSNFVRDLIKKFRKKNKNNYQSGWNDTVPATPSSFNPSYGVAMSIDEFQNGVTGVSHNVDREKDDTREIKKPVEVLQDIIIEQPIIDLRELDHKIEVVRRRISVLTEQGVRLTDEYIALDYLLARKKYAKFKSLFKWKVTTKEKINVLLSKYKLQTVSFPAYYKCIPNEALDEIEKFADALDKVSDKQPELSLVIDYKGPEQKKDPILLACSPFGMWYYVLGAWDKEVEYVDDLIYNGK